ncbi:MAG TPA: AtpZ/AtpI family protein [Microthrixaceae bacterium]|nr:AtpZ/AtpI family protein [Microthrixaceae bacterium]
MEPKPLRPVKTRPGNAESGGGASASYEFVFAPVIFALFGVWLDRAVFHTSPILTITFAVLGLVGATIRLYYGYRHHMAQLAEKSPFGATRSREAETTSEATS